MSRQNDAPSLGKQASEQQFLENRLFMANIGMIASGMSNQLSELTNAVKIASDSLSVLNQRSQGYYPVEMLKQIEIITTASGKIYHLADRLGSLASRSISHKNVPVNLPEILHDTASLVQKLFNIPESTITIQCAQTPLNVEGNQAVCECLIIAIIMYALRRPSGRTMRDSHLTIEAQRESAHAVLSCEIRTRGEKQDYVEIQISGNNGANLSNHHTQSGLEIIQLLVDVLKGEFTTVMGSTSSEKIVIRLPIITESKDT